jgi:mannonate dehydratase
MRQTWRWFGPHDTASIDDMLQSGVEGVVTALHHVPTGAVWTPDEIARRQEAVRRRPNGAASGLEWEVVESLPVSEDIKLQSGAWRDHVANYAASLENLAAAGVETICYNFMPVLDWTRTDLSWRLPHGGSCMRFDYVDFALFDIHILRRRDAAEDYPEAVAAEAAARLPGLTEEQRGMLARNVTCGLPGAAEALTLDGVREQLDRYKGVGAERLRSNFHDFLEQAAPVAERLGLRLCCHPDDPPFPLLGLPRIMSTEADCVSMLAAVDTPANGLTLCSGSLGARPDNDLPGMMRRLGGRVHFLHLRNVRRESAATIGSFHESEHLGGDVDMVALVAEAVREEAARKAAGRRDWRIPMRPDHGQDILDDLGRRGQPGYPTIGRMRGLAELRGVMQAFSHPQMGLAG